MWPSTVGKTGACTCNKGLLLILGLDFYYTRVCHEALFLNYYYYTNVFMIPFSKERLEGLVSLAH